MKTTSLPEPSIAKKLRELYPDATIVITGTEVIVTTADDRVSGPEQAASIARFKLAAAEIKGMVKASCPSGDFERFREVNKENLQKLQENLPAWFAMLDKNLTFFTADADLAAQP